jgi:DNA-directed RNA polymerase specialized sigma24 family protein
MKDDASRNAIDWERELTRGYAIHLIRRKVRRLVRHPAFVSEDPKDLEQDLVLRLLERRATYDPVEMPWRAFVTTVVAQGVRQMLQFRKRHKRFSEHPVVSLGEMVPIGDDETTELQQLITPKDQCRRLGLEARVAEKEWERREDLQSLVRSRLTPEEQDLCRRLRKDTISNVARELKVPRSTLRDQLAKIQEKLGDELF